MVGWYKKEESPLFENSSTRKNNSKVSGGTSGKLMVEEMTTMMGCRRSLPLREVFLK